MPILNPIQKKTDKREDLKTRAAFGATTRQEQSQVLGVPGDRREIDNRRRNRGLAAFQREQIEGMFGTMPELQRLGLEGIAKSLEADRLKDEERVRMDADSFRGLLKQINESGLELTPREMQDLFKEQDPRTLREVIQ